MDWEMLGAVGELVGAAGVVFTLFYLARQIRGSNRAARERALQELLDHTNTLMRQLSQEGDFAETFARGSADFASLAPAEQLKLRAFYLATVMTWQRFHHLEKSQDVEDWAAHTWRAVRHDLLAAPGFRTWFEDRKHWLDPEFRSVLESEIREREPTLFVPPPSTVGD